MLKQSSRQQIQGKKEFLLSIASYKTIKFLLVRLFGFAPFCGFWSPLKLAGAKVINLIIMLGNDLLIYLTIIVFMDPLVDKVRFPYK